MIISKKNFDKALAEREKQIFEKMDMSRVEREKNRYLNERIDELERLVHRMSDELDMLLDIKKKYEEVCVTAPQRRW